MLGDNIKKYRKINGMSQTELGERLHVTQNAISQWENNIRVPELRLVMEMADLFEISVDALIGNDNKDIRLLSDALPLIEIAKSLDEQTLSQWLSFGKWLIEQRSTSNNTHSSLSSSDNEE